MVNQRALRVLAHTARILLKLEDKPEHPAKDEYTTQIEKYRLEWKGFSPEVRSETAALAAASAGLPDMTPPVVDAAFAALEV